MPISLFKAISGRRTKPTNRTIRPTVDGLEDRMLLYAASGGSWAFPQRITYSIVPDGTRLTDTSGGSTSNLFATMNAKFPGINWQDQIQRAAAVWSAATNINLVPVSDNGTALGVGAYQQGDPGVGDIRIGGTTTDLTSSQLAMAYMPPPFNGGSISGDIVLNDNQDWQINANYDLQTVMIHEIGHALGLEHSTSSTADMFANYNNIKQTLTTDDISGIQSIYSGARKADAFEGASPGNYNSATATNINSFLNTSNYQVMLPQTNTGAYPDIMASTDQDWYKVTVPTPSSGDLVSGSMVIQMQSANLSSLSPRVQVYNSSVQSLAIATAPSTYGATVSVTVTNVSAGQVYYFRATAANTGATGNGAYGITVNFGKSATSSAPIPSTSVYAQADQGGGSSNENNVDIFGTSTTPINGTARLTVSVRLFVSSDNSASSNSVVYLPTAGLMAVNANGSIDLNTHDQALDTVGSTKKASTTT